MRGPVFRMIGTRCADAGYEFRYPSSYAPCIALHSMADVLKQVWAECLTLQLTVSSQ